MLAARRAASHFHNRFLWRWRTARGRSARSAPSHLSSLTKVLDQSSIGRQRIAQALSGDMSYRPNRHPRPRRLLFRYEPVSKVVEGSYGPGSGGKRVASKEGGKGLGKGARALDL